MAVHGHLFRPQIARRIALAFLRQGVQTETSIGESGNKFTLTPTDPDDDTKFMASSIM
jgi:hypothetical protein